MHEAELRVPTSWQDQSMQVFRVPDDRGGSDASFIVTRDYEGVRKSVATYADEQISTLKQKFPGFKLLGTRESTFDGVAGMIIDYEWTSNGVVLRQRQAYVPTTASMLALTLTGRTINFDSLESAWQTVLSSLRLHSEPAKQDLMR
jgi:hypothetical protein